LSPPLKAKIKLEAEDLNLLKKTARLPIWLTAQALKPMLYIML
jgi:hypothetical protein